MNCHKCKIEAIDAIFNSFRFMQCPQCKMEVVAERYLLDEFSDLLRPSDGKRYLYVSGSDENLDKLGEHLVNSFDFAINTTKVYLIHAQGIKNVPPVEFDGIYIDAGWAEPADLSNFVKTDGYFRAVNGTNMVLI